MTPLKNIPLANGRSQAVPEFATVLNPDRAKLCAYAHLVAPVNLDKGNSLPSLAQPLNAESPEALFVYYSECPDLYRICWPDDGLDGAYRLALLGDGVMLLLDMTRERERGAVPDDATAYVIIEAGCIHDPRPCGAYPFPRLEAING